MKAIFINVSPRKNMNTAKMLNEAMRGAESAEAETEFIARQKDAAEVT